MSKSKASGRSPFGRRADRTGSVEVFIRPERSVLVRLLAVLWHLRTELVASVVGVWVWLWLTDRMPTWAAIAVLVLSTAGLMGWGPSRRFVLGHAWCTVTRHRLRSCLMQSRVMNHRGYVPWCLWVRPTKVGERVWLLMRPGICVEDLDSRTPQIAAACWARDARVRAWRRLVAVVLVDVVRRDPLTAGKLVRSPLPGMAGQAGEGVPAGLAGIPVDLSDAEDGRLGVVRPVLSDGDAEDWELGPDASGAVLTEPAQRPAQKPGLRSVRPAAATPARPVAPVERPVGAGAVSSSGEDVTDYV
jgi:hypothetical protein